MSPLKHSNNFAARMGRWSASHWKTAVFGWLAFVVASFVIGNAVGTKYLETSDTNVGETRQADKIIEAGFPQTNDEMGEIVLIQSKTLNASDPAFRAVITDVTKTLDAFPQVTKLDSPLEAGHADLVSKDGRSVMVVFSPKGDYDQALTYIAKIETAVDKAEKRHPGFSRRGARQRHDRARHHRRVQQHAREGRDDRHPADPRDPAARVRVGRRSRDSAAAGDHRRLHHHRVDRDPEPVHPGRRADRGSHPPDRPGGRHRLLALLPPA